MVHLFCEQMCTVVIRERSSLYWCVPSGLLMDGWCTRDDKALMEVSAVQDLIFGAVEPVSAQGAA